MAFAATAQHDNSRAAFLSGLRTGGPRSVSPMPPADGNRSPQHYGQSPDSLGRMKANAAVFTPSGPQTPPDGYNGYSEQKLDGLEEQLAAMRMHALAAQKQSNLSKYGMSHAQLHYQDERAIAVARQQQQEQQQLQIQMTMMQLQAQHQQHQQQQHIAVQQQQHQQQQQQQQQQIMLAKLHAEYERLNSSSSSDNDALHHILGERQHASAQEQRQAAQASIQNSLRYRQAQAQQQLYQSMLDGQQTAKQQQRIDAQTLLFQQQQQHQQQQQQFQQQLLYAQLQAQAQAASMTPPVPLEQRSWRSSASHSRTQTPPSVRSGSPAAQAQATNASSNGHKKAADSASSWRKTKTPSIVVDDSASDTQGSVSDNETPQTSEENAPSSSFKTEQANTARMHSLPQRAVPVSAAPRTRAFADQGSRVASDSAPGSQTTIHPQRQPHGPPTDVRPTNFSARLSQRTRREALSKLNALVRSPRTVAAFSGIAA